MRKIGFTVFHSHSTVLEVMLLLGAIGLVLFLLVYVSAVSGAIKALDHDSALARWALLILGVQFVLSLSEVAAFGPWLPLMAAICVLTTRARRATPAGSPAPVPARPEFGPRSRGVARRAVVVVPARPPSPPASISRPGVCAPSCAIRNSVRKRRGPAAARRSVCAPGCAIRNPVRKPQFAAEALVASVAPPGAVSRSG